ncbi:MAG: DUF2892 domain-containing protein [Gammaproteobacteria bacterium]|nr:DUF2892 domain-containing protein [Gammaproteobacteria bacterium]
MNFEKNVGRLDAVLRTGLGAGMGYVGLIDTGLIDDQVAAIILGVFGIVIFSSGIFRRCPLYSLIGFNSRTTNEEE